MQRLPSVYVTTSPVHGRGVFTYDDIPEGSWIEFCPVIVIPKDHVSKIHETYLHDFYFFWGKNEEEAAIALGFGSIYNHSYTANAEHVPNEVDMSFSVYATRDILAGEEIFINYNGDDDEDSALWFNDENTVKER